MAETRSFSRASEMLAYTQPAISQHVLLLERRLGHVLIDRSTRPVGLTKAGRGVAASARDVLDRLNAVSAMDPEAREPDELRIVCFPSAVSSLLPGAIAEVRNQINVARLSVATAEPDDAVRSLCLGGADLAIVHDYPGLAVLDAEPLDREDLFVEELRWVFPDKDPVLGRGGVAVADIAERPWIGTLASGPARSFNQMLGEVGRQFGFDLQVAHETNDTHVAQALVAAGMGVLVLPGLALETTVPGVVHSAASDVTATRRVSVLRSRGASSPAAEAATAALRKVCSQRTNVLTSPPAGSK